MKVDQSHLDTAIKAAHAAGEIHLKYFGKGVKAETKSNHFNIFTVADVEAEDKIVSIIRESFPGHNFIAEEKKYAKTDSEFCWIVDPLDGTNNFAHKIPVFCVSIALAFRGMLQSGVVFDPTRNELFTAVIGNGALLNSTGIEVSGISRLRDSVLTTGFYYDRGEPMLKALEDIKKFLLADIIGIRRFGSAALDLCNVASGRGEGFWELMLNPWDFAAGKLIVEEAGGRVTDEKGRLVGIEPSYIVASNGKIHEEMLAVIG